MSKLAQCLASLFRMIFIREHEYKFRNIIKWCLVFVFFNSIYTDLSKYSIGNVARCPSSFSITFSLLSLLFCLTDNLSLLSSLHQPCHVLSLSFFIVLCKCIGLIKPTLSKHHSFATFFFLKRNVKWLCAIDLVVPLPLYDVFRHAVNNLLANS